MRKNFKIGLGVLVFGAVLMGASYRQTNVQADLATGITAATKTYSIIFLVGVVFVILSLLFFLMPLVPIKLKYQIK